MRKFQKGNVQLFLPIIVFVFIALTSYLVLRNVGVSRENAATQASYPSVFTPTVAHSKPKLQWKTYTNDEFNYSLDYPSNWETIEAKSPNEPDWPYDRLSEDQLHQVRFSNSGTGPFYVSIEKNPNNFTTDEWAKNYKRPLLADPSVNLAKNIGEVMVGEKNAYKFEIFSFDGNEILYGFVHNSNIYTLSYYIPASNEDKEDINQENYDYMLSSFKFLEGQATGNLLCPENGWIDCMPGPGKDLSMCTSEADEWLRANCPDYQGFAY